MYAGRGESSRGCGRCRGVRKSTRQNQALNQARHLESELAELIERNRQLEELVRSQSQSFQDPLGSSLRSSKSPSIAQSLTESQAGSQDDFEKNSITSAVSESSLGCASGTEAAPSKPLFDIRMVPGVDPS